MTYEHRILSRHVKPVGQRRLNVGRPVPTPGNHSRRFDNFLHDQGWQDASARLVSRHRQVWFTWDDGSAIGSKSAQTELDKLVKKFYGRAWVARF
jgi:hypothetical protein